MSSQFLFDKGVQEVVPYNAQFHFPSQATRTKKTTIKLPPKTAKNPYTLNDIIRFEFPASGYLNPLSVMWELDCYLISGNNPANYRIQNNISSVVSRAVIKYGSLVLEDIRNYNLLCRVLTDVGVGQDFAQSMGFLSNIGNHQSRANNMRDALSASNPARFLTPLLFGIFQQRKLIPLKWMSSQLIIELYLESSINNFLIADTFDRGSYDVTAGLITPSPTSFNIGNTVLIYDLYEFDASYDEAFMEGLQSQGIPLQMTSWHNYTYGVSGTVLNAQIQERARSVKMAMAVLTAQNSDIVSDSHATFSAQSPVLLTSAAGVISAVANSGIDTTASMNTLAETATTTNSAGLLLSYQYRIGGAYYPAQEVEVHRTQRYTDRCFGREALFELQKALDTVGSYQSGSHFNSLNWCNPVQQCIRRIDGAGGNAITPNLSSHNRDVSDIEKIAAQSKYSYAVAPIATGPAALTLNMVNDTYAKDTLDKGRSYQQSGSTCVFAVDLETSNGMEIAGINAEEQSDILLSMKFDPLTNAQAQVQLQVFTSFDMLLIFRPNNQVEKIS